MLKKSVQKRIRVTRTGKLIRRKIAQGHFRANKSSRQIREKRGSLKVSESDYKNIIKYL